MGPLSPYQKARCLDAMDKIEEHQISKMFSQPVDPIADNCPNYFEIITRPMDLGTARRKLENDEYCTVDEWKSDIDLIWTNTLTFNGSKTLVSVLAKHLQTIFKEITSTLTSDPEADWNTKFEKLKAECNAIIKAAPKIPTQIKYQRKILTTRSMSQPPSKIVDKDKKVTIPPATPVQDMTTDDLRHLADDMNLIEDDDQVDEMLDLIKRMEPDDRLVVDDDLIELDITKLKTTTLFEMRLLVNRLLGRA